MEIKIDGTTRIITRGRKSYGFTECHVIEEGQPVSCQSIPTPILGHGGKCHTGGRDYEVEKPNAAH